MGSGYLWVKAFHIVFIAAWFAALFYLPRLFVNLTLVAPDSPAERARLLLMARKLHRFGVLLIWRVVHSPFGQVLKAIRENEPRALSLGYHHACARLLRRFEQAANRHGERWFRVFNEASVLLFAAIVVLVVVKPAF